MGLPHKEDIWEPAYHLIHAKEAVSEFHYIHPDTSKPQVSDM